MCGSDAYKALLPAAHVALILDYTLRVPEPERYV